MKIDYLLSGMFLGTSCDIFHIEVRSGAGYKVAIWDYFHGTKNGFLYI